MAAEEVKFVFSMDDKFSEQAKKAEGNANALERSISRVGAMVVGAFSVSAIANFGRSVVQAYGNMEMFKTALTTMLKGNAGEAEALNNTLINIAKTTPFELTEVQQGARQLIAYGTAAGDVGDELIMLGNVASGVGSSLSDISYLYGTIRTQGVAMTMDIRQFANRGIPIWEQLTKVTGKSGEALKKYVEEGKVHFKDIQQVFRNLTAEGGQFAGLMEAQSKTVTGQLSNLSDSWEQLKVNIGESQSGIIKSTTSFFSHLVQDISDYFAQTNRIEKAFAKHGAKNFGFFESHGYFGFGSQKGREEQLGLETLAEMWANNISKLGKATSEPQRLSNISELHRMMSETAKGISSLIANRSTMEVDSYKRQLAVMKDVQDQIRGTIDLLKAKKDESKTTGAAVPKETDKESRKLKSPHYTQININIDKLNDGGININQDKGENAARITGEEVIRAMVSAVTDAQIVAGAIK